MQQQIVVSGMRPTGVVHLGHYVGVLKNYVRLQAEYQCYFFIADWHALTSNFDQLPIVYQSSYEYLQALIAVGVDPNKAHLYCQSSIPEVLYLNQLLLSLTPTGWADRSPSWKDLAIGGGGSTKSKLENLGFYTYPVLQTADVAIMKGELVPVGEDQVTHLEMGRELIRKFNRLYPLQLPEAMPILSANAKLLGTDGNKKMSSSLDNYLALKDGPKVWGKKIAKMKTDDQRLGVDYPGNPDNCSVNSYHQVFSPSLRQADVVAGCTGAKLSCGECKKWLCQSLEGELAAVSEKMGAVSKKDCENIVANGNQKAREQARSTWGEISEALKFTPFSWQ